MFAYRVICRQSPEHIDVKDFKLLKYSQRSMIRLYAPPGLKAGNFIKQMPHGR